MDSNDNSTGHSSDEDTDAARPAKRAKVATRTNPPRTRNPTTKKKQTGESNSMLTLLPDERQNTHPPTDNNAIDALEKRLARFEKAASKKDQEIARLKAELEDRGENRRERFPNGSPGNSDVESEDDIGGNAADSVNVSYTLCTGAHDRGSPRLNLCVNTPPPGPVNSASSDERMATVIDPVN